MEPFKDTRHILKVLKGYLYMHGCPLLVENKRPIITDCHLFFIFDAHESVNATLKFYGLFHRWISGNSSLSEIHAAMP